MDPFHILGAPKVLAKTFCLLSLVIMQVVSFFRIWHLVSFLARPLNEGCVYVYIWFHHHVKAVCAHFLQSPTVPHQQPSSTSTQIVVALKGTRKDWMISQRSIKRNVMHKYKTIKLLLIYTKWSIFFLLYLLPTFVHTYYLSHHCIRID